jgi:hypothetical protein
MPFSPKDHLNKQYLECVQSIELIEPSTEI